LRGFGAKSSAALLNCYGSVEAIPDSADAWEVEVRSAPRLAATLAANRDAVALYKDLATLRFDVPLKETFADLEWRGAPERRFEAFAERIGGMTMRPQKLYSPG